MNYLRKLKQRFRRNSSKESESQNTTTDLAIIEDASEANTCVDVSSIECAPLHLQSSGTFVLSIPPQSKPPTSKIPIRKPVPVPHLADDDYSETTNAEAEMSYETLLTERTSNISDGNAYSMESENSPYDTSHCTTYFMCNFTPGGLPEVKEVCEDEEENYSVDEFFMPGVDLKIKIRHVHPPLTDNDNATIASSMDEGDSLQATQCLDSLDATIIDDTTQTNTQAILETDEHDNSEYTMTVYQMDSIHTDSINDTDMYHPDLRKIEPLLNTPSLLALNERERVEKHVTAPPRKSLHKNTSAMITAMIDPDREQVHEVQKSMDVTSPNRTSIASKSSRKQARKEVAKESEQLNVFYDEINERRKFKVEESKIQLRDSTEQATPMYKEVATETFMRLPRKTTMPPFEGELVKQVENVPRRSTLPPFKGEEVKQVEKVPKKHIKLDSLIHIHHETMPEAPSLPNLLFKTSPKSSIGVKDSEENLTRLQNKQFELPTLKKGKVRITEFSEDFKQPTTDSRGLIREKLRASHCAPKKASSADTDEAQAARRQLKFQLSADIMIRSDTDSAVNIPKETESLQDKTPSLTLENRAFGREFAPGFETIKEEDEENLTKSKWVSSSETSDALDWQSSDENDQQQTKNLPRISQADDKIVRIWRPSIGIELELKPDPEPPPKRISFKRKSTSEKDEQKKKPKRTPRKFEDIEIAEMESEVNLDTAREYRQSRRETAQIDAKKLSHVDPLEKKIMRKTIELHDMMVQNKNELGDDTEFDILKRIEVLHKAAEYNDRRVQNVTSEEYVNFMIAAMHDSEEDIPSLKGDVQLRRGVYVDPDMDDPSMEPYFYIEHNFEQFKRLKYQLNTPDMLRTIEYKLNPPDDEESSPDLARIMSHSRVSSTQELQKHDSELSINADLTYTRVKSTRCGRRITEELPINVTAALIQHREKKRGEIITLYSDKMDAQPINLEMKKAGYANDSEIKTMFDEFKNIVKLLFLNEFNDEVEMSNSQFIALLFFHEVNVFQQTMDLKLYLDIGSYMGMFIKMVQVFLLDAPMLMLFVSMCSYARTTYMGFYKAVPVLKGFGCFMFIVFVILESYRCTLLELSAEFCFYTLYNSERIGKCEWLRDMDTKHPCIPYPTNVTHNTICRGQREYYDDIEYFALQKLFRSRGMQLSAFRENTVHFFLTIATKLFLWTWLFWAGQRGFAKVMKTHVGAMCVMFFMILIICASIIPSRLQQESVAYNWHNIWKLADMKYTMSAVMIATKLEALPYLAWVSAMKPSDLDPEHAVFCVMMLKIGWILITGMALQVTIFDALTKYRIRGECFHINGREALYIMIPNYYVGSHFATIWTPIWVAMMTLCDQTKMIFTLHVIMATVVEYIPPLRRHSFVLSLVICATMFSIQCTQYVPAVNEYVLDIYETRMYAPLLAGFSLLVIGLKIFYSWTRWNDDFVFIHGRKPFGYWTICLDIWVLCCVLTMVWVVYFEVYVNIVVKNDPNKPMFLIAIVMLTLTISRAAKMFCATLYRKQKFSDSLKPEAQWQPYDKELACFRRRYFSARDNRRRYKVMLCEHLCLRRLNSTALVMILIKQYMNKAQLDSQFRARQKLLDQDSTVVVELTKSERLQIVKQRKKDKKTRAQATQTVKHVYFPQMDYKP